MKRAGIPQGTQHTPTHTGPAQQHWYVTQDAQAEAGDPVTRPRGSDSNTAMVESTRMSSQAAARERRDHGPESRKIQ